MKNSSGNGFRDTPPSSEGRVCLFVTASLRFESIPEAIARALSAVYTSTTFTQYSSVLATLFDREIRALSQTEERWVVWNWGRSAGMVAIERNNGPVVNN